MLMYMYSCTKLSHQEVVFVAMVKPSEVLASDVNRGKLRSIRVTELGNF